ncbi:hypothetical protein MMC30_005876 [Trapelia coarctata]|nr:hypothetical protein [Trapelia coarctata]
MATDRIIPKSEDNTGVDGIINFPVPGKRDNSAASDDDGIQHFPALWEKEDDGMPAEEVAADDGYLADEEGARGEDGEEYLLSEGGWELPSYV